MCFSLKNLYIKCITRIACITRITGYYGIMFSFFFDLIKLINFLIVNFISSVLTNK